MAYPLKLFATATYDEFISTLVAAGLLTFGLQAPRGYRVLTKVTTFTTTMWVVYWVHRSTANGRTNTTPACSTCFTQNAQHMLSIANFAQSRAAVCFDFTHFTRTQTQGDISTVTSNDLNVSTSGTSQLTAFTWFHFYVMNGRTNRDIAHRQGVACFDCSINARLNLVASFQAFRGQDVTALAVFVQNQRDVRGAVRIVLKTFNNCRDTIFVAFEVNNTVSLLVATTDMTGGDTAIVVTTTGFAVFPATEQKVCPCAALG